MASDEVGELELVAHASLEDLTRTVSKTKEGTWLKCGYQFFRRYVLGEKKPPTAALAYGRGFDKGADVYYSEKMDAGAEPSLEDTRDMFRSEFEEAAEEVEEWPEDEPKAALVDSIVDLAAEWKKKLAEATEPAAVQRTFRIDLPKEEFAITGVIDLIARTGPGENDVIAIDTKTSGRKWNQKKVLDSLDAPIYSIALIHLGVADADRFLYHVAVKSKEPTTQLIGRLVNEEERNGVVRRLATTRLAIRDAYRSGTFLPNRSHPMCSKRWCGYWRECMAEWGGQVAD